APYLTPHSFPTRRSSDLCQDKGLATAPSYKTFVSAVKRRPRYEQVNKRAGPRAAYPNEPMYWELLYELPRHGDRPFEVAHIDHRSEEHTSELQSLAYLVC